MTPELAQKLYTAYPEVFPPYTGFSGGNTPFEQRGFEVDDGWFDIIDTMAGKLQDLGGVKVSQIKQKLGPMRVYIDVCAEKRQQAAAIVAEAAAASELVCEKCGADGSLVSRRHWLLISCESCLGDSKYLTSE
jgi:hypothetical protein